MNKLLERLFRRKRIYNGKVMNFSVDKVSLPNGKIVIREYMEHPGAVAVLPVLCPRHSGKKDEKVILVKQYRYPVKRVLWEIPAGKLDKAKKERLIDCVRRELREETGYVAGKVKKIFSFYPTPAFATEILHIFVATNLKYVGAMPDDDEFLKVKILPFRQALHWVKQGKICDAKSVIALLLYDQMTCDQSHTKDIFRQ